ncbi:F-box domain containing protein [Tanacetum coccineum]
MVFWTSLIFLLESSLWVDVGSKRYKACPTCNEDTLSIRVLSKTAYVGHRRFLKKPHKWRRSLEFNGQTDNKDPPNEFGRDAILAQLDRLPTRVKGKHLSHRGVKIKRNVHVELKWTKRKSALQTLRSVIVVKAQIKVGLDFLWHDWRLIYPPALFDIMVHLVIHLPIEALEGGPIRPRPEIDTYRSQFKSLFPNKDMQEEFPNWFGSQIRQRHVDNDQDPEVSTTSELFALANGPSWTPISVNSCVVDGVRYVVHSRDERRTTQNSGICSPGPDGEMYYGQLQEIIEFKYLLFKVALFRVKLFDTSNKGRKVNKLVLRNNMTQIDCSREAFKDDQYILDDPDIIHFDNSYDLPLSTSSNDLNNATLHIDGQSTVVDAPPDIIDIPDEDDDIIDDEDALLHDLADSDTEDLINVDDDGVEKMLADVARSHGGDGGSDDRPPSYVVPTGSGGYFANKGKGKRKPNLGGRGVGRLNTRDKTRNLSLKDGSLTLFDLRPHMDSSHWTEISEVINMHLQKANNTNKASFKAKHWKADPTIGTYDVEAIMRAHPEEITAAEWDKYIQFWNDPKNLARAAQNRLNWQKSAIISRQGSRSLARLRDEMRQASDTQEYPSLIDTFWRTHTVDGVFPKDEDRRIYVRGDERLKATGEYTEDEINALARGGKLRGHIPGVGRVLPSRATSRPSMSAPVDKSLKSMHRKVDFMMSIFRSDSKYSNMFKEFESGGASGSGGCGDDEESGDDEDDDGER